MRVRIEDVLTVTMKNKKEIDFFSILIENGKISCLSKKGLKKKPGDLVINGRDKIALPGLINSHIHSDITLARGLGDGLTLYEQDYNSLISRKRWFREELDAEARQHSRLLQFIEAVKGGTTFICDVPFWWYGDDLISAFRDVGITGAVVLDYRKDFSTGERVKRGHYFKTAELLRENGIIPIVEAPAEEHFEKGLLQNLAMWAEELDTLMQLHLAETTWRMEIIKKRFNSTSVKYLKEIGVLNERLIGSHGVYLNEEDINILKECGARIVNCPVAEMKIADGIAPVPKLITRTVPLGLGTDGALWNDSSDIFSEMKSLMLVQRVTNGVSALSAWDALYAATRGGAAVFNLEGELGSIEKGKRAHIILIDTRKPHLTPIHHGKTSNVLQLITSCAKASDVDTVIIDGKIIVMGGKIQTVDEQEIINKCIEKSKERFKNTTK
ncbi:MAG: amidohydrolase family protein [Spirochaetota bacterium]